MSETKGQAEARQEVGAGAARAGRKIAAWKKALLTLSCVLMVAGLGLQGHAYIRGPAEPKQDKAAGEGGGTDLLQLLVGARVIKNHP